MPSLLVIFGPFADPCLRCHVVSEEEGGGVWVIFVWCIEEGCSGGIVVDDNGCVFKSVDADCVTCACLGSAGLDVVWPL